MAFISHIQTTNGDKNPIAIPFGACSTAIGTAAKAVSITNFPSTLEAGMQIAIKFTNGNSASSPTLSINSGTAKSITTTNNNGISATTWAAGAILQLTYDGATWVINSIGAFNAAAVTAAAALATLSSEGSSSTEVTSQFFKVTPSYTNTDGYIVAHSSAQNGTLKNYKVKGGVLGNITGGAVHIDEILLNPTAANITLSTTDNGIPIRAEAVASADNATVSVSTAGWLPTTASKTLTGDSTSDTYTRYITAITVPKTTPFDLYMVAETGTESLTADITIHTANKRRVVINNDEDGVVIHGANGKTVWVNGVTVTDASGDIIPASSFSMTGSTVTDVVTVGSLSSGYYPISAKVKGAIKPSTQGWLTTGGTGAVQATTATQVGKIAASSVSRSGNTLSWGSGYIPSGSTEGVVSVSNATTLYNLCMNSANAGIHYIYTGTTTTYTPTSGDPVTFTNGNIYRYQA